MQIGFASRTRSLQKASGPYKHEKDEYPFLEALLPPHTRKRKVAFGTEGGLFSTRLAVPTVVCGPGDIDVAHKPDEYVALAQLDACDAFLARLIGGLQ
jgi:acetylornithine deacetylase